MVPQLRHFTAEGMESEAAHATQAGPHPKLPGEPALLLPLPHSAACPFHTPHACCSRERHSVEAQEYFAMEALWGGELPFRRCHHFGKITCFLGSHEQDPMTVIL